MSWLDAHESFFMDLVAEDRIADLNGSIDADAARSEVTAEGPRPVSAERPGGDAAVWSCVLVRATR